MSEEEKESRKKVVDQYTRETSSTVWSSGFHKEFTSKYQQQNEEFEREYEQRLKLEEEQNSNTRDLDLSEIPNLLDKYEILDNLSGVSGIANSVKKIKEKSTGTLYALKVYI